MLGVLTFSVWIMMSSVCGAQNIKKVGYLDLSRIFDSYDKTKEYDGVLEEKHNTYQQQRNEKIEKFKEKQGKLALLKEDEKGKLQTELDELRNEIQEFDRQNQTELTRMRDEKFREILLEIEKVVADYAKKENYDLIFNDRVLIYSHESLDITEQILKTLNTGYNTTNTKK
jgi:outer membrane protein